MLTRTLRTSEVDVARSEVARLFCDHRLTPGREGVRVRLHARRRDAFGIVHLDYGQPVRIDPGLLEDFYLVQVPLAGRALIAHGGQQFVSTPARASVLSPDEKVSMAWGEHNPQLICWFPRSAVDGAVSRLAGTSLSPLRFDPCLDVTSEAGARWVASLTRIAQSSAMPDGSALLNELLAFHPHTHSDRLARSHQLTSTQRAMAYMEDHLDESLTLARVAAATGVGVRALQKGFRSQTDTSPMEWLRHRRLDRVHQRLTRTRPGSATVTEIASAVGIQHLGRFAGYYRARFGESPSDTLARPVPADVPRSRPTTEE